MMKGTPGVSHVTHATTYLYGMLKQPVSNRGSILLGELVAIKLALKHIFQYKTVVKAAILTFYLIARGIIKQLEHISRNIIEILKILLCGRIAHELLLSVTL